MSNSLLPLVRNFGQNIDGGAHIFAALGVVRGRGEQAVGPVLRTGQIECVKFAGADAEEARIAADFVEGNQPMVPIECGIFEALGHGGTGELLKFENEPAAITTGLIAQISRKIQREKVANKVERSAIQVGRMFLRLRESVLNPRLLHSGNGARLLRDVGAINREENDHLAERAPQLRESEILREAALAGNQLQAVGQGIEFADE